MSDRKNPGSQKIDVGDILVKNPDNELLERQLSLLLTIRA